MNIQDNMPCIYALPYQLTTFSLLKTIIKYYHKRQSQKVASPANSFGIGSVLNWLIKVAWPTESVDTNQQTPVCRFFSIKTLVTSHLFVSQAYQTFPRVYQRLTQDHQLWLVITNENIQVTSHEFTEHFSYGHHMCDVVSRISRHSQLCWTIRLQIKLKHNHLHLMASIKSYLISSKLFTSLLVMPTLSLISVSSPVYANRLVLLCR